MQIMQSKQNLICKRSVLNPLWEGQMSLACLVLNLDILVLKYPQGCFECEMLD